MTHSRGRTRPHLGGYIGASSIGRRRCVDISFHLVSHISFYPSNTAKIGSTVVKDNTQISPMCLTKSRMNNGIEIAFAVWKQSTRVSKRGNHSLRFRHIFEHRIQHIPCNKLCKTEAGGGMAILPVLQWMFATQSFRRPPPSHRSPQAFRNFAVNSSSEARKPLASCFKARVSRDAPSCTRCSSSPNNLSASTTSVFRRA